MKMADRPRPTQPSFLRESDPDRSWSDFVSASMATIDRATGRAVRDQDLAADVASEVLERLAKDWPALLRRYEQSARRADFFVWLAVVARNLAVDVLRSRFGRAHVEIQLRCLLPVAGMDEQAQQLRAAELGPALQIGRDETQTGWVRLLEDFSPEERFFIRAYCLEGGTAKAVAAATNLGSVSRVYETMKIILRKLRRAAEARGLGHDDLGDLSAVDWGQALRSNEESK